MRSVLPDITGWIWTIHINAETYLLLFEHIVPMCIDKMEQNQEISISFEVKTENNKIEDCRDDQPSIKE